MERASPGWPFPFGPEYVGYHGVAVIPDFEIWERTPAQLTVVSLMVYDVCTG
jgi:hypothetical protein